ncbi:MAG: OsmC family protein [Acidobacteriota bacterium]|nr:OsmC family protein [Acidobacteriota bacterium]
MADKDMLIRLGDGYKVDAEYKGFLLRTDQPVRDGGEGSAPAPFDLFLASLGTCAGYYVLAFCRSRSIPADGITLRMTTARDPRSRLIDKISIVIQLSPDFPEKYRTAVVRAAESCTVKAHLLHPPEIEVRATAR